jgi:hypothetical protein
MRIKLTQGKYALIDESDAEKVNTLKWCLFVGNGGSMYATAYIRGTGYKNRKMILMHRFILGAKPWQVTDHINHNGLDNRRANIRLCSRTENMRNKIKQTNNPGRYKGVWWETARGKWQASICIGKIGGKKTRVYLGRYDLAKDAAKAYDNAAKKYFGEFAYVNGV